MTQPPIRILVVDDSAMFRMVLVRVLGRTPGLLVVGNAASGHEALDAARRLVPDVITLDVEMPGLDGLATLTRLLADRPTRVVMLSRATSTGAKVTLDAVRLGALDAIAKPEDAWGSGPHAFVDELVAKIQAAALVPLALVGPYAPLQRGAPAGVTRAPSSTATRQGPSVEHRASPRGLVVIATSTGGPRALDALFGSIEAPLCAGVVVVQHMLTGFTAALAQRLDHVGPLRVREATTGDHLADGAVLLAPGDRHILIDATGRIRLTATPPVVGLRPAADVTLRAAAPTFGSRLLAVVLTGMGRDGTDGAALVKAHGGFVIAQDEASSALFGMPRAVAEAGLADRVLPLHEIAAAIANWARTLPDLGSASDRPQPYGSRPSQPIPLS